jgi:hypothetical protein
MIPVAPQNGQLADLEASVNRLRMQLRQIVSMADEHLRVPSRLRSFERGRIQGMRDVASNAILTLDEREHE